MITGSRLDKEMKQNKTYVIRRYMQSKINKPCFVNTYHFDNIENARFAFSALTDLSKKLIGQGAVVDFRIEANFEVYDEELRLGAGMIEIEPEGE